MPLSCRNPLLGMCFLLCGLVSCTSQVPQVQRSPATTELSSQADAAQVGHSVIGELQDQNLRRTYYLHVPPGYQPHHPLPLVVALHESQGQGKTMADHTGLNQIADREGFLVIYPDAINKKWNVSGIAAVDSVAFVHQLIDHMQQTYAIDASRIYAVGLSNGGILVQKLACENPGKIAAFASVAASLPNQFKSHCQSQTGVSMLMINGTADPIVRWAGGAPPTVRVGRNLSIPPIPKVIDFWRQQNDCTDKPTVATPSQRVEITAYTQCPSGIEVTLVALKGGGHIWPGGSYGQSPFLDAGTTVWEFFQRHSRLSTATAG